MSNIIQFPDQNGQHRDQIVATFMNHCETLWNMLEGNDDAQAELLAVHKAFNDRDALMLDQRDNLLAQVAGLVASMRTAVNQRDEALNAYEQLEHDIRHDPHGSANTIVQNLIERVSEDAEESAQRYIVSAIASNLEVNDFDAEDLIAALKGGYDGLELSAEHKDWMVEFLRNVGEYNRQQKAARR